MFLIKRIITVTLAVIGSLVFIILLALINSVAHSGLTGGQVVLYGLISGIVIGILVSYLLINYFVRRVRKILFTKFGNALSKFNFLRRI